MAIILFFANMIVIISYAKMSKNIRKETRERGESFNVHNNMTKLRHEKQQKKVTRITLGIMISYIICGFPYFLYLTYMTIDFTPSRYNDRSNNIFDKLFFIFILLKCICDAMVYIFRKGCSRKLIFVNYSLTAQQDV